MTALRVEAEIAPAGPGVRVLVVDDEVLVRALISETLREAGCEVIEAASAEEAIEVLRATAEPDVLVTDVMLPGEIDGVQLAARVRQTMPNTKVIVTSGHASATEVNGVADVFLPKPFELWRLIGQVRSLAASA